ncbi:hypothetical protein SAMN02746095_01153 [Acidocella aminolytica 101 = DSM 11237]|jgi:hypothetical protein|nr:hypothetical protein SAMN02746095_01153 [Acidocella aminolytica 101 = DSM 11237]
MLSPREEVYGHPASRHHHKFPKINIPRAPEQIIGFQRYIALSVNSTPI